MAYVTLPKNVDVSDRLPNAALVPTGRMRTKSLAVKVISECGVERESITVDADYRHDFSELPLDIGTPSKQMDRTLEESGMNERATITRRHAIPKDKSSRNVAI